MLSLAVELVPDLPWHGWLLAGAAVVLVGIAKSGFGGGVGIVAVPMFVLAMGSQRGVATLLPLLIAADIFSVYHHWGKWDRRNLLYLLPASVVGITVGALIMDSIDERGLAIGIGVICVLYVVADQVRRRFAPHWKLRSTWTSGSTAGLFAGITSTLAHAAGPVITIFLIGQHLPKSAFIGTAVIYFFIVNNVKLIPYGIMGLIDPSTLWQGLWLVPLVPVGTFIGARINRLMSEWAFRLVILVIVFLTGVQLIIGKETIFGWLGVGG